MKIILKVSFYNSASEASYVYFPQKIFEFSRQNHNLSEAKNLKFMRLFGQIFKHCASSFLKEGKFLNLFSIMHYDWNLDC